MAAASRLTWEKITHDAPRFDADRLCAETRVLENKESSKGDRGVVYLETRAMRSSIGAVAKDSIKGCNLDNLDQAMRAICPALLFIGLYLALPATGQTNQQGPLQILEQAELAARTVQDPVQRDIVVRAIGLSAVVALLKAGDLTAAHQKAEGLPYFWGDEAKLHVALAYVKAGDLPTAHRIAAGIGQKYRPEAPLSYISVTQARVGDIQGALRTAAAIQGVEMRAKALGDIAVVQADGGDITGALQTASLIPLAGEIAVAMADIALVRIAVRDIAGATKTFEEARKSARAEPDGGRRNAALAELAAAHAKAGWIQLALEITQEIKGPRKFDLWGIAFAQAKAGDVNAARKSASAGAVAAGLTEGGHFDLALRLSAEERDPQERAEALRSIGLAQVRAGQGQAAATSFQQALQSARAIRDPLFRYCLFRKIAETQAEAGDISAALKTVAAIPDKASDDRARALRNLTRIQSAHGDLTSGIALANGLSSRLERASALLGVVEGILDVQDPSTSPRFARRQPSYFWTSNVGC